MFQRIFMLLLLSASLFAQQIPVAVNELSGQGISSNDLKTITNSVRHQLVQTRSFKVLERAEMDKILKEQAFSMRPGFDETQNAIELGKLLPVTHIVTGNIGKIGEVFTLTLKLIDLKTGLIQSSVQKEIRGELSGLLTSNLLADAASRLTDSPIIVNGNLVDVKFKLQTNPIDTAVFINDSLQGKTPFNTTLLAGEYKIRVQKDGFRPAKKSYTITTGVPVNDTISLRKNGKIFRLTLFALATGAIIAGSKFDDRVKSADSSAALYYQNATSGYGVNVSNEVYQSKLAERDRMIPMRNISYVTAGIATSIFAFTIFF